MTSRLVLGLAVLVLVTGCGGDDTAQEKREYEQAVRAVVADARAGDGTPAALRAAADELRDLDPPDEVAGPHRDLVAGFDAVAAADARGAEPPDEIVDRILAARRAFAARRYDIGVYGPLSGS
jgi:Flp pilus assembly protein TadB